MVRIRKKAFVAILFCLALAPTLVAAAVSGSPGSTTTIQGMPVIQNFSGLTAGTAYDIVLYSPGTNVTCIDDATADSDGELSVTIDDFNVLGVNSYVVQGGSTTVQYYLFTINNMNVIPYLTVGLIFVFIGGIFSFMKGIFKFQK